MLQQLATWLLPRLCAGCGFNSDDPDLGLCSYCRVRLPWLENRCYQCASPLQRPSEVIICDKCKACAPQFNRVCALFDYKAPLPRIIATLKFGQQLYPAEIFGNLMADAIIDKWYYKQSFPQLIIPIPLHIKRHRERGYNQAAEIAKPISKITNIPLELNACIRHKSTKAQSKLDRAKRLRNLSAAFSVNLGKKYQHVAIVDDVMTTGSTVRAVSQALVAAGVQCVDVWCVCRA